MRCPFVCGRHLGYPMQQIRIIGLPSQPYVSDAGQWVPSDPYAVQRGPFYPIVQKSHIYSMAMTMREFVQQIPNRLGGIIAGLILVVNADAIGDAVPSSYEKLVDNNMQLIGGILISLSLLRLGIDWYLTTTAEADPGSESE